jgi:hypothetical protein
VKLLVQQVYGCYCPMILMYDGKVYLQIKKKQRIKLSCKMLRRKQNALRIFAHKVIFENLKFAARLLKIFHDGRRLECSGVTNQLLLWEYVLKMQQKLVGCTAKIMEWMYNIGVKRYNFVCVLTVKYVGNAYFFLFLEFFLAQALETWLNFSVHTHITSLSKYLRGLKDVRKLMYVQKKRPNLTKHFLHTKKEASTQ